MKKTLTFIITTVILAVSLLSCSRGKTDDIGSADIETPFGYSNDGFIYIKHGRIFRYDIESKRLSIACPDPLCDHNDESCFSYRKSFFTVCGDRLYAVEQSRTVFDGVRYTDTDYHLWMYDLKAGAAKIIYSSEGEISYPREVAGYVYFPACTYVWETEENPDGTISSYTSDAVWNVYRYDITNDMVEKLSDKPTNGEGIVDDVIDGRLYWEFRPSDGNWTYISSDLEFHDIRDEEKPTGITIGDSIYTFEYNTDLMYSRGSSRGASFSRTDPKTGESETFFEDAYDVSMPLSRDGVAYTETVYDEEEEQYVSGGTVWFCSLDGEKRILYEILDGLEIDSIGGAEHGNREMTGDWIHGICHYTVDEYDEWVMEDGKHVRYTRASKHYTIFINIETGENFIVDSIYEEMDEIVKSIEGKT